MQDLFILQHLAEEALKIVGRLRVVAERLFQDDPCSGSVRPYFAELVDDGAEERRRDLEVKERSLGIFHRPLEPVIGLVVRVVARHGAGAPTAA